MWIGGFDTAVCLRCRLRINRPFLIRVPTWAYPPRAIVRTQSTAAAVIEDEAEGFEAPKERQRGFQTPQKRLRRKWKPPRVAELGVSSLGKPAEVLVLNDRNKHVPAAVKDEAERIMAPEPQILEALQAEDLPLSSENVKQSLDHISLPYRTRPTGLSARERAELRKKILGGFTHDQLRSYCLGLNRANLASPASMQSGHSTRQKQEVPPPAHVKEVGGFSAAAKVKANLGKRGLVDYIISHMWALSSLADEQGEERIKVNMLKLKYMLSYRQLSLEEYARQYDVAIDASRGDGIVSITGKRKHVIAARCDIRIFCKAIASLPVRSVTTGKVLGKIATTSYLNQLAGTYKVLVAWASEQDPKDPENEGRLIICCHKSQSLENALNAERDILCAERDFLPAVRHKQPQERVSMWLPKSVTQPALQPDLVSHQAPENLGAVNREKEWARWVIPQPPMQPQQCDSQSTAQSVNERLTVLNRLSNSVCKLLKGGNDEFFFEMSLKHQKQIRKLLENGLVKEEVFTHFGKILFADKDMKFAKSFPEKSPEKSSTRDARLLSAQSLTSAFLSPSLPGAPNYLSSLSPFGDSKLAVESAGGKIYKHKYRLRYLPLLSRLYSGFETPPIEIDIVSNSEPGSSVAYHVTSAWAILDEQYHKLLAPAFVLDLEFVRRLKRKLHGTDAVESGRTGKPWLKKFAERIGKADSNEFPPFVEVDLPQYSRRRASLKHDVVADDHEPSRAQQGRGSQAGAEAPGNALDPVIPLAAATVKIDENAIQTSPRQIEYMLDSWELIHSTAYKAKNFSLEHICLEGRAAEQGSELLRLARQPLFDDVTQEANMPVLLERAFKISGLLSDPHLLGQFGDAAPLSTEGEHQRKSNDLRERAGSDADHQDE